MASWALAWPFVRAHEVGRYPDGGFTDRPSDRGGPTKWGIPLRTLQGLGAEGDLDGDGDVDVDDVQAVTEAWSSDFGFKRYWLPLRLELLESQDVATKIVDLAFNMGCVQATKVTQAAVNRERGRQVLVVDGAFGPLTRQAVNRADEARLLAAIRLEALAFYWLLLAKHPDQEPHRDGWELRAAA